MEFSTKAGKPEKLKTACLVVGVYEDKELGVAAGELDQALGGLISDMVHGGDMKGKAGSTLVLHRPAGCQAKRVLLVGLGKKEETGVKEKTYRDAVAASLRFLAGSGATDALIAFCGEPVAGRELAWKLRQAALMSVADEHRADGLKSKREDAPHKLKHLDFLLADKDEAGAAERALAEGKAMGEGMNLARALADLPANVCTPSYLADQAKALAEEFKLKIEVLDRDDMEKLGMGALLSVARGSHEPPRFIVLSYRGGKKKEKPVVLVGKGITFDSGGISLKPGADMDEMKYDMCGAASVLGTMRTAAMLKLPLNVVAVVPATENMPGGRATKPGDIVTSLSGQTIEILNTDAEGRLILCDALTWAERLEPACVVDVATLTGAVAIALGAAASGLLANDDELAGELLAAGRDAADKAWQLPLWDEYQEQLQSNFADMPNIGTKGAGSITAACFLSRFTKKYKWAHLDIAGTAWKSGKDKGATGRPVPLLAQFLLNKAAASKAG